jgi:transposase-like protein
MAAPSPLRRTLFTALTGSQLGELRGMLLAVGGATTRTRSGIDLTAAARKLGVSRRTVERWVRTAETGRGQRPSPRHAQQLTRRARQAVRSKSGRQAIVATARQQVAARGARLSISGLQGPHAAGRDYMRRRLTQLDLDPAQAGALLDAYTQGGEQGFLSWATDHWGREYLDDWTFGAVETVQVDTPQGGRWQPIS